MDYDVIVVGAGPAGLTMAVELGLLGLTALVLERREGVNPHPRARSVNIRTGEIFNRYGILDEIEQVSLPQSWTRQFVYTDTLAGREIGRVETAVQPIVDGERVSPVPWLLTSQDRIEPILTKAADGIDGIDLCWGTGLEPTSDGGSLPIQITSSGVRLTHDIGSTSARWLIAADGAASTIREQLEIEMVGRHGLATLVNCQFWADLDRWTNHRPAALYWTTAPFRNVFQKIDTDHRWLCQIGYDPREHDPSDFNPTFAAEWIKGSIGVDVDVDVTDVIPWTMSSTVAATLRSGPVFLIGDAAHQLPPSGGFGMNTAVQDAHNLAWKLAYVARGWATEALLDTYHAERAPIARYNADRSLENTKAVGRIRRVAEAGGDARMSEEEAVAASGRYGSWLGMDLGVAYAEGVLIPDGTPPPAVDDPVIDYRPVARPGHRAPWVELGNTASIGSGRASTLDHFDERFTLVSADRAWAASGVAAPYLQFLTDDAVAEPYELGSGGACLVRPDGHVAWRLALDESAAAPSSPAHGETLHRILARLGLL